MGTAYTGSTNTASPANTAPYIAIINKEVIIAVHQLIFFSRSISIYYCWDDIKSMDRSDRLCALQDSTSCPYGIASIKSTGFIYVRHWILGRQPVLIAFDCGSICNNNFDVEFFNPISNTALTKSLWSDSGQTNRFFNLFASIISCVDCTWFPVGIGWNLRFPWLVAS